MSWTTSNDVGQSTLHHQTQVKFEKQVPAKVSSWKSPLLANIAQRGIEIEISISPNYMGVSFEPLEN